MKKLLAALLAAVLCLSLSLPCIAWADNWDDWEERGEAVIPTYVIEAEKKLAEKLTPADDLPVKSAILMVENTGQILFELNADMQLPPASVTKIMSLLLIMEAVDSGKIKLTDKVTCSEVAAGFGGSQIWLKPGEEMTVDELLKATAISSANDATVCLAEYVAGSEMAFVQMMNQKADELEMTNTEFKCAAGLDNEGHLTTSRDIAIMSRELLKHPIIKNYTTIWMDSLRGGATELVNTNRLVRFYPGATGLKTGTTSGAGSCLSATAERDGLGLIAVVMGADTSDHRFAAARALLDWGFANYMVAQLDPPQNLMPVRVVKGIADEVEVYAKKPEGIVVEKNKSGAITQDVTVAESVEAPVTQNQELGSVAVCVDGERVLDYPILATNAVERMTLFKALGLLLNTLFRTE